MDSCVFNTRWWIWCYRLDFLSLSLHRSALQKSMGVIQQQRAKSYRKGASGCWQGWRWWWRWLWAPSSFRGACKDYWRHSIGLHPVYTSNIHEGTYTKQNLILFLFCTCFLFFCQALSCLHPPPPTPLAVHCGLCEWPKHNCKLIIYTVPTWWNTTFWLKNSDVAQYHDLHYLSHFF